MWIRCLLTVTMLFAGLDGAQSAVQASEQELPIITFTDGLYLPTVEGADAELAAGTYQVGPTTDTSVTLIGSDPSHSLVLQATVLEHDFPVSELTALLLTGADDSRHLVLLRPEGKAWDVVGTATTGIRSRAVTMQSFNSVQLKAAVVQRPAELALASSPIFRDRISAVSPVVPLPKASVPIQAPVPSSPTPSRGPGSAGIFLLMDGIVGESQDISHRGWIFVQGISWASARAALPQSSIITISKLLDAASPFLAVAGADGRHMRTATIDFIGALPGTPNTVITLTDVEVIGYAVSGSTDSSTVSQEILTLTFSRGEWAVGNARGLMNTMTKSIAQ